MSDQLRKEFGKRVRTLREQGSMSIGRFGLVVGLNKSFLIQVEHGRRNPSLDTIEKIAAGLGITVSELFEGIETHIGDD